MMRTDQDYIGRRARVEKRTADEDMTAQCESRSEREGLIEGGSV